ncbi:hypothetical protein ACFWYW_27495 [Nonomuraea sp. NPDC059023]|uniref:hypothetical protein n=1 Tax=unclassified Nonomuraea TaxID=2593643 RepID=UPI00368BED30
MIDSLLGRATSILERRSPRSAFLTVLLFAPPAASAPQPADDPAVRIVTGAAGPVGRAG